MHSVQEDWSVKVSWRCLMSRTSTHSSPSPVPRQDNMEVRKHGCYDCSGHTMYSCVFLPQILTIWNTSSPTLPRSIFTSMLDVIYSTAGWFQHFIMSCLHTTWTIASIIHDLCTLRAPEMRTIILLAEVPVLRTDLKVFLPLYFFSLSWQLEFEDQPPYASWVAYHDHRAMHAHVSSYSAGCTFKSARHTLWPSCHTHALRSYN